tara:strand:- start:467 stop:700 length:234 start_codon:yes stop_codon:yes gene_type:complete
LHVVDVVGVVCIDIDAVEYERHFAVVCRIDTAAETIQRLTVLGCNLETVVLEAFFRHVRILGRIAIPTGVVRHPVRQ